MESKNVFQSIDNKINKIFSKSISTFKNHFKASSGESYLKEKINNIISNQKVKGKINSLNSFIKDPLYIFSKNKNNSSCLISNENIVDDNIKKIIDTHVTTELLQSKLKDVECAICNDEFKEDELYKTLECNHNYHLDCILLWFNKERTCPLCRRRVEEKE